MLQKIYSKILASETIMEQQQTQNRGMNEWFEEIMLIDRTEKEKRTQYYRLDRLVERMIKDKTKGFAADFTNMAARTHALCKATGYPPTSLERFRCNAAQIKRGELQPDPEDYLYDLKAVCEAISFFYNEPIPEILTKKLPHHWRNKNKQQEPRQKIKRIRLTVTGWNEQYILGKDNNAPDEGILHVSYRNPNDETGAFDNLPEQLYDGAQLNLLSVVRCTDETHPDISILKPELIILDPDFLVDITAICACIKPYGKSALNHIVNKFAPNAKSAAIQLGNLANRFLDDCVNEQAHETRSEKELYRESLHHSFGETPIEYTTLPGIDKNFFDTAEKQFHNIRETVKEQFQAADIDIERQEVQLEPSFLCEALGIQGRMDLMLNDFSKIVELKSGKAQEFPELQPQEVHGLQMALYKEILYYSMDVAHQDVETYLFYSRYPRFYNIRYPKKELQKAMALRNEIVHLERRLRQGHWREIREMLTEEQLVDPMTLGSTFYPKYLRKDLMQIINTLHQMKDTEEAYFNAFVTFLEREQFLAKTGDDDPDSGHGFAETWNADTRTKQSNGNILTDLKLTPVEDENGTIVGLEAAMPEYGEDFLPNFRPGDLVMLYERNTENDLAINKQIFRCQIEEMGATNIRLKLSFKQRNKRVFHTESRYALEPGYMDATFTQGYKGLFELLQAPKQRKDLILGLRLPKRDEQVTCNGHYTNQDIDHIVTLAKQAKDYFLLVGPPGTGKTSVALRSMVLEFLSETPRKNLLLMAYTNRAVDEICKMLDDLTVDYARIGQELSCEKEYRKRLLKNIIAPATNRKQIFDLLEPIQIVVGTISSIAGKTELFQLKRFDVALIDEASQVLEPQLLPLLCATTSLPTADFHADPCAITKFILIGDHKQLPAVVVQPNELSEVHDEQLHDIGLTNCRNSLFERLHHLQIQKGTTGFVALLNKQGRMHETLSDFVNRLYYNEQLQVVPLPHQLGQTDFPCCDEADQWTRFVAHCRMGFIPVTKTGTNDNNKVNRDEAQKAAELVKTLYQLYLENHMEWDAGQHIGIIVPFRGQIAMTRKMLNETGIPDYSGITIDTVERYQGSQRDTIIYCITISQKYQMDMLSTPVETDGICIDRKLNVALTRARKQFFLIGNPLLLRQAEDYRKLLDYIQQITSEQNQS